MAMAKCTKIYLMRHYLVPCRARIIKMYKVSTNSLTQSLIIFTVYYIPVFDFHWVKMVLMACVSQKQHVHSNQPFFDLHYTGKPKCYWFFSRFFCMFNPCKVPLDINMSRLNTGQKEARCPFCSAILYSPSSDKCFI